MLLRHWALALPAAAFLAAMFVLPLGLLVALSVVSTSGARVDWSQLTASHYARLLTDPYYLGITLRTFGMAAVVTALTLLLGYPFAYAFSRLRPAAKGILLGIVLSPILTGTVIRSYGWIVILGRRGLLNDLLLKTGVIDEPLRLLFNMTGVVIALTQVMLPFMIIPLIAVLVRQDWSLEDVAMSLGASRAQAILRVTFPLSLPGVIAGCALVFILAYSSFTTPALIGGGTFIILPTLIYQQTQIALDWGIFGSVSMLILVTSLLFVWAFLRLGARLVGPWATRP